jgi:hypothetical protein
VGGTAADVGLIAWMSIEGDLEGVVGVLDPHDELYHKIRSSGSHRHLSQHWKYYANNRNEECNT